MKFTPKTEKQIQEESLIAEGQYEAEVVTAEEQTSKSGNPMLKLKLKVYLTDGAERTVYDYLLEAMAYKLRHFMVAAGMEEQYNSGHVNPEDLQGVVVLADIGIKAAKGEYQASNTVRDYEPLKRTSQPTIPRKPTSDAPVISESDIPF